MAKGTFRIPDTVIEDTHAFRREVDKFMAGETSAVAFRAIRVPMGIYEQRENDTYMVRVRGAGGVFLPHQVERIAELSELFGNGKVHVTTRQDLQIHRVLVHDTPTVLERLLEVGLSSRGGGGNTVRNVSSCPYAGVCPDELFDVTPYAIALTEYLLDNRANFNLPRKFKVAFSGCSKDCALCSVADVGFFAHERDGVQGFAVYAGGGMGAASALSVLIEEFIPAAKMFEVAEAVKRLFDKHGDRVNRHRARLRFVLERVGPEEFRRLYREELERVRREEIIFPKIELDTPGALWIGPEPNGEPEDPNYQAWKSHNLVTQKQDGLYTVRIPLRLGNIKASDLCALGDVASALVDCTVRTTQDQDLQLRGVPEPFLPRLYEMLKLINESLVEVRRVKTVACAGASTCKLGLCLSRGLAEAIEAELEDRGLPFDDPIRISGCPNSCGQHPIAPIGLYGTAKRVNGRLAPYYTVMVGGRVGEGDAALSRFAARVPARVVPTLLRAFWAAATENLVGGESIYGLLDRWGEDYLRELGQKYAEIPAYEDSPEFYRDFGSEEDFSLAGRGPGECGAGVMDVIALDIDTAKTALESGALYDAIVAAARALLVTRGLEPKKDREVFSAFSEHIISPGWVERASQEVLDAAMDFKLGDRESLEDLRDRVEALIGRVEVLFASLDSGLNFRVEPIKKTDGPGFSPDGPGFEIPAHQGTSEAQNELDLRGVACPMNFVRAKIQLEQLDCGDVLDILLDDGEPVRNVPASFSDQGETVVSVDREGGHFRVRVKRNC